MWNGRFYGKPDRWSVYFSGKKVDLTNAQKESMEEIQKQREIWRRMKKEIDKKYSN